jgi:fibronectin type 3 domain-containing protein
VNNAGQKAAFSNFFLVEPTASVAQPPTAISSEVQAESILLKWASPAANIDNSKPVNILGYNIYRAASVSEQYKVLNSAPITRNDFEDVEFDFGAKYKYFVRTVSLGSAGQPIESQDSQTIEVTPKDVFPPSAPGSITIAASQRAISIFFINNPERDIAGYRVYRSLDRGLPLNQWLNLTPELLQTNVFQDEKVERETRYFYYLIAVDKAGNVSEPSEIVTEALP